MREGSFEQPRKPSLYMLLPRLLSCRVLEAHTRLRGLTAGRCIPWRTSPASDNERHASLAATPGPTGRDDASTAKIAAAMVEVAICCAVLGDRVSPHHGGHPIGPRPPLTVALQLCHRRGEARRGRADQRYFRIHPGLHSGTQVGRVDRGGWPGRGNRRGTRAERGARPSCISPCKRLLGALSDGRRGSGEG